MQTAAAGDAATNRNSPSAVNCSTRQHWGATPPAASAAASVSSINAAQRRASSKYGCSATRATASRIVVILFIARMLAPSAAPCKSS